MRVRPGRVVAGIVLALPWRRRARWHLLNTDWASRRVAREAAAMLEARFDGRVRVESLSMTLFPRVAVSGTNLRITRDDGEAPMLEIARFEVSGTPLELFRRSFDARRHRRPPDFTSRAVAASRPRLRGQLRDVRIGEVRVRNGRLVILPDDPQKLPLEFGLQDRHAHGLPLRSLHGLRRAAGQPQAARADPDRRPVRALADVLAAGDARAGGVSLPRRRARRHQRARRPHDVERQVRRRARAHRRRRARPRAATSRSISPTSPCPCERRSRRRSTARAATCCSTTSMRRSASRAFAPTARWRPHRAPRGAPSR